jgi:Fe2+ transport system protein FeoA
MSPDAATPSPAPESLSALQPGEHGRILAVDLPGSQRGRVLEMGLTVGATIQLVRFAPLGDPIEFKVRGASISLRKSEAAAIRVARL